MKLCRRHSSPADTGTTTGTSTAMRTQRWQHDERGIEWEDDMVEVNRMTTPANMRWKIVDRDDREPRTTRSTGDSGSVTR